MSTHVRHRRARVLVVDDELACRVLVALLLEQAGYEPIAVATVERAVERLDGEGAEVVLTDLIMPRRGGIDLLRILRDRRPTTPALAVTGSADEELIARALALGAKAVIQKPFGSEALRTTVRAVLEDADARDSFAA
jgi:CheY-like chemotaxis protein